MRPASTAGHLEEFRSANQNPVIGCMRPRTLSGGQACSAWTRAAPWSARPCGSQFVQCHPDGYSHHPAAHPEACARSRGGSGGCAGCGHGVSSAKLTLAGGTAEVPSNPDVHTATSEGSVPLTSMSACGSTCLCCARAGRAAEVLVAANRTACEPWSGCQSAMARMRSSILIVAKLEKVSDIA